MNPVLRKDIVSLLRLRRTAAIQLFFIAALGLMVLATWPQAGVVEGSIQVGEQVSLVRGEDNLLLGLVVGQIVLLILFVPGIASVALTGEKEANTLEMLYASRLTPREIITGKVGMAVIFPLLLLISALPFMALLNYRGDVRAADVLWAYLVLFGAAAFLSMISLAISAACRESATALVIAYLTVLALCGAVLVPAAIMIEGQTGTFAAILHYVRGASPVAAAMSLLRPHTDFAGAGRAFLPLWQVFLPFAGAAVVVCGGYLTYALSRSPAEREGFGRTGQPDPQRTFARRVLYLIDPTRPPKPMRGPNPLIPKERRTNQLRSGRWMIRIFYGALFLSLALAAMALYGGPQYEDLLGYMAAVLVAFQLGLIALVVPSLTSSTVSSELETGTFELLRLAPLRAGKIFWGKFIPAFLPAALPLIALLPAYGAVAIINSEYITRFAMLVPVLVLAVVFCSTLGLLCSCLAANTARATVAAYLVTAALFVLPLFGWWMAGQQLSLRAGATVAAISPLAMGLNLMPNQMPEVLGQYNTHLWIVAGLCVLMLLVARVRLSMLLRHGND